jgi:catechol 2,3-dioxygenase-like lactoylglutathione lyase family enzyme
MTKFYAREDFRAGNDSRADAVTTRAIPVLPSRDTRRTLAFYRQLGFANLGAEEWRDDYLVLRAGELEIHFFRWDDLDPEASGALCHLQVGDADALHRLWSPLRLPGKGVPRMSPVSSTPWGVRQFALVDPDGNCLSCRHMARELTSAGPA